MSWLDKPVNELSQSEFEAILYIAKADAVDEIIGQLHNSGIYNGSSLKGYLATFANDLRKKAIDIA